MEEAMQKVLELADKLSKDLSLSDYRDLMNDLSSEFYTRYESAENDLSKSGEA